MTLEKRLRRGAFKIIPALEQASAGYLDDHITDPRPFAWTAAAYSIIDRIKTACQGTSASGRQIVA